MRTAFRSLIIAGGIAMIALIGCQSAAGPVSLPPGAGAHTPVGSSAASISSPSTRTPAPPAGDERSKAWLVVGRAGTPDLQLMLSTTGEVGLGIPAGAPRSDWERMATATIEGDSTIVRDVLVQPGLGGPRLRLPGRWKLPTIGLDATPAGRSLDGSTIALVEGAYEPSAARSRFAIVEHRLLDHVQTAGDAPLELARVIELPGAYEFDALSPDGRILYVVQHLDAEHGGRYQVRAIDMPTGVMRDAVIADKGNPDERMAGSPIAQLRQPNGLVLTLYRGPEHPFIHALMSTEAWALCIDLPADATFDGAGATRVSEPAASLDWGLAATAGGSTAYAVNPSLGAVVDVDLAQLSVRRSAMIDTETADGAAPRIALAKLGHGDVGPVGRRVVVSPDGSMLYAAGPAGLVAIRTTDLVVTRRDLAGSAIDGLGITTQGTVLFALVHGSGEIVALDADSGARLATVPGSGYDRLLAVAPW